MPHIVQKIVRKSPVIDFQFFFSYLYAFKFFISSTFFLNGGIIILDNINYENVIH